MPFCGILGRMNNAVGLAALRPDEQQNVLARGNGVNLTHKRVGALNGMTVHFDDDVAGSEARIVGRARRANALNRRAVDVLAEC